MPFRDVIGHERPKTILRASILNDHVAHAYLFHGEEGIGKRLTAVRFAQALNCDTASGSDGPDACGTCRSCLQIEARTHPDFTLIEPEPGPSTGSGQARSTGSGQAHPQIKIEQIRELEAQVVYRPLIAQRRVCLIDDADRMTLGAANALLKTLEEPPGHSLFVLISSRPYALPATIRSRCQSLRFAAPARTQVEAALMTQRTLPPADARFLAIVSQGRLGQALRTDPGELHAQRNEICALTSPKALRSVATLLTAAEALHKSGRAPEALEWIARWVRDLLLVRVGADPENLLNLDRLSELKEAARGFQPEDLLEVLGAIEAIERAATRNVNLQMALESVLLRLRDAVVPAGS